MKKLIATALAVTMLMANSISASAVTTGKWDFGAIRGSVSGAVQDIVQNQECQITYDFNGGSIWDFSSGFNAKTEYTCTAKGTHIVEDPLAHFAVDRSTSHAKVHFLLEAVSTLLHKPK